LDPGDGEAPHKYGIRVKVKLKLHEISICWRDLEGSDVSTVGSDEHSENTGEMWIDPMMLAESIKVIIDFQEKLTSLTRGGTKEMGVIFGLAETTCLRASGKRCLTNLFHAGLKWKKIDDTNLFFKETWRAAD
jgi:hypothetical protein